MIQTSQQVVGRPSYCRDGSGLKRNWLQNAASVNVVGGGGTLGPATGRINGLWGKD